MKFPTLKNTNKKNRSKINWVYIIFVTIKMEIVTLNISM